MPHPDPKHPLDLVLGAGLTLPDGTLRLAQDLRVRSPT